MTAPFPHLKDRLRRHVREVWESRGGGFYGFVAMLTFLYLEAVDLAGDISSLPGFLKLDVGWVIGWFVNNAIDAVRNLVWSVIWPVEWIGRFGVSLFSLALLGACYGVYRLIRPWVLRLLEDPVTDSSSQPARPVQ
jgi:hypothetical protein